MDRGATYDFGNPKHVKELDLMSLEVVASIFGEPTITAEWDMPRLQYWQPGQPRPIFADDDPAVQQAVGRCATARIWRSLPHEQRDTFGLSISSVHPRECGWCDMPIEELLAACDWATFEGRTQVGEWHAWTQERDGRRQTYQRRITVRRQNNRHAAFWEAPKEHRQALITRAQYETVPA
jgi:hypothetical protein